MNTHKLEYTEGSGNIYEDLGFPDSEERLAKARLAMRIENIIEKRKLKQAKAAEILGINQPKISALMNGRLSGFSIERLIHYLNLLDQDVEIIVKTKPRRLTAHGRLSVAFG
jgi:predicted XRE-type DNA-binding protein